MSVIPKSQLALMRKRRQLKALVESGQWEKVIEVEADLFVEIDSAVNDSNRSPQELLKELGQVISLYRELSDLCCMYGQDYHLPEC